MTKDQTEQNLAKLLRDLRLRGDRGQCSPVNADIAEMVGLDSVSSATRYLQILEKRGDVKVTRYQAGREITITATGKTLPPATKGSTPHWRIKPDRAMQTRPTTAGGREPVIPAVAVADRPRVYRDPCFKCGVRADIGCHHSRAAHPHTNGENHHG